MYKNNELIETIVHDLKSPLTVLKGTVDYLSYEIDSQECQSSDSKKAIKTIKRSAKNIENMIDSILTATLIEQNKALVEQVEVKNLTYLLKDYCSSFKYDMKTRQINFKTYIQKNLPSVSLDIKRVKNHILNNIITNAVKFTPKGGIIKVSAFEDEHDIIIVIEDNGPGIPEKDRANIFKKQVKLNTKSKRAYKSFGLGLYNAMHFTKLHGGTINVSTSIYDKGTSFSVRFPKNK